MRSSRGSEEESSLVESARRGDTAALDRLLRQHQPKIYSVCRRLAGNDADALDATQEAMMAVVRGLPRFDGRSRFSTWLYRVATNACLDELRRRGRRPVPSEDLADQIGAVSADQLDREAEQLTDRLLVDQALGGLAEEFKVAVVLRDLAGLDYAEIAEVLDIPPGTVRSRIARGRAQLAARIVGNPSAPSQRPTTAP